MRTVLRGLWLISVLGASSNAALGCTAPCSDSDSCGTYVPPEGGGGNHAGAAGNTGAASGAGGAGAASGAGTTSGAGGASGSDGTVGGAAGDGGAAGGSIPCDTSKDPSTESCLIDDDYAVFVAPGGKDDADGTKSTPLATLSKATEIAGDKFIVVCDATYDEHVTITTGARIYGGFKCTDWSAETGAPLFKPTTTGPALKIDTVTEPLAITGLKFEVADATSDGETALTAIANASPSVTLEGVTLKAGKGKAGAAGTLAPFTFPDPSTLNGNAETVAGSGGASKTCMCQATLSSTGGLGGSPVTGGQNGSDGSPALGAGKAGDHTKSCSTGGGGDDGNDAPATVAASGATSVGIAAPSGWQPSPGKDGVSGSPGQGGGGGASRNDLGHGGGGGCGGCGGNGASAGKGGGGSIALLLINSPVQLDASALVTADAGDGGAGVAGQPGQQQGGNGGNAIASGNSCGGGTGGKGGDGGASGGGAGGISVGIVWKGAAAPTVTESTTTTGKAGAAGLGGVPGTNDGISGTKQDVLQVP